MAELLSMSGDTTSKRGGYVERSSLSMLLLPSLKLSGLLALMGVAVAE